jgi:hypothetical protein
MALVGVLSTQLLHHEVMHAPVPSERDLEVKTMIDRSSQQARP